MKRINVTMPSTSQNLDKAISIEIVNRGDGIRLIVDKNCSTNYIDISKELARDIRDKLNTYLND